MNHPFITGEKVYLRGIEKKDLEGEYFQWANNPQVTEYMFMGLKPNHIELLQEEYDRSIRSSNEVVFLIMDRKTDKPIGSTGLYRIEWPSRHAEYRIFIGEPDYWDSGYGSEVGKLMLAYGFDKLNMNKIWLGVNSDNVRAVKSYENAGFVYEGKLRAEIYRNGTYYDATRMSVLREEYYSKARKK